MHTIVIHKKINGLLGKMYVAAVAKAMGVHLPSKVKLITSDTEKIFHISGFSVNEVKIEKPGD